MRNSDWSDIFPDKNRYHITRLAYKEAPNSNYFARTNPSLREEVEFKEKFLFRKKEKKGKK